MALNAAQLEDFYEIMAERYLKAAMVIKSNRRPQDWMLLFPDPVMADSVLDYVVHRAHHILIEEGDSYSKKN